MSYYDYSGQSFSEVVRNTYFNHRGRLSPQVFVVAMAFLVLAMATAHFVLYPMCALLPSAIKGFVIIGYIFTLIYSLFVLVIKRLHDLNHTGWFSLFIYTPFLNLLFLLYLIFKHGDTTENKFGHPSSYSPPKIIMLVSYSFFIVFMSFPFFVYLRGVSNIKSPQTVQEWIDSAPEVSRQSLEKEKDSLAIISINDETIAMGVFITRNRLLIRGTNFKVAVQNELDKNQKLKVRGLEKTAHISRFIASDDSLTTQMAVFEVDQPIGKPGSLGEENKKTLERINAFK